METFNFIWLLLESHGVVPGKQHEAAQLWATFTTEQQREIYRTIRDKIQAGKFVHYNPVIALRENAPKQQQQQILSYEDYYQQYRTTEEQDGWKRVYQPEKRTTIYVKGGQ